MVTALSLVRFSRERDSLQVNKMLNAQDRVVNDDGDAMHGRAALLRGRGHAGA